MSERVHLAGVERVVVVVGPTAAGKSALAEGVGEGVGGGCAERGFDAGV